MILSHFWRVEEEKFITESKYPSIHIDRCITTKKRLWRYLYKEGIGRLQTEEQRKTPFFFKMPSKLDFVQFGKKRGHEVSLE
jgi:hypothetical protein